LSRSSSTCISEKSDSSSGGLTATNPLSGPTVRR
jgi:hypothetical protein